jgi:L-asparaginase
MACMMLFGALPPAADPENPSTAEKAAIEKVVANYQRVFDTH